MSVRFKYYLRGCGLGILVASLVFIVSLHAHGGAMSDEKAMQRASELGMIMPDDTQTQEAETQTTELPVKETNLPDTQRTTQAVTQKVPQNDTQKQTERDTSSEQNDTSKESEKKAEEKKKTQDSQKKEEEKKADKKKEEEKKAETIQADSIEDLIAAIKAKLHPEETADTTDTEENTTEQNTTCLLYTSDAADE